MTDRTENSSLDTEDQGNGNGDAQKPGGGVKAALEFGPMAAFFIAFKFSDIMVATAVFMAAMAISVMASRKLLGHVSKMLWFNLALVLIAGGLTLAFNDERFIKIKPTILFGAFAFILVGGLLSGRLFLKDLMGASLPAMPDAVWRRLTFALSGLYAMSALANEVIRTNYSTDTWVTLKFAVMMPALVIGTMLVTMVIIMPYFQSDERDDDQDGLP